MFARLWVATALLGLACGGADNQTVFDEHTPEAGAAGSVAGQQQGGTSSGAGGAASAGQASGGTAAGQAGAGMGGAAAGGAGAGGAGAPEGGSAQAGTGGASAGAGGRSQGGDAGAAQGGSGDQGDPLEAKPVPGCPGFVSVYVPKGTCAWFHGTFEFQNADCNVINSPEMKCATVTSQSKDNTSIISDTAEITRYDLDVTGCPHKCN